MNFFDETLYFFSNLESRFFASFMLYSKRKDSVSKASVRTLAALSGMFVLSIISGILPPFFNCLKPSMDNKTRIYRHRPFQVRDRQIVGWLLGSDHANQLQWFEKRPEKGRFQGLFPHFRGQNGAVSGRNFPDFGPENAEIGPFLGVK